jgi:hypothetical protein
MRRITSALIVRPPVSAARAHVVGLVLLALLLQALSPLLHARLLAAHAASTGARIDVAAFCLPGHTPPPAADPGGPPPPVGSCLLCQGTAPAAADVPTPSSSLAVAPTPPFAAARAAPAIAGVRTSAVPTAHRPRGPPPV